MTHTAPFLSVLTRDGHQIVVNLSPRETALLDAAAADMAACREGRRPEPARRQPSALLGLAVCALFVTATVAGYYGLGRLVWHVIQLI